MTWADDAIRQFGETMGLDGLVLSEKGTVSLSFERRGHLFIEQSGDVILLYLARAVPFPEPGLYERALEACHYRENLPFVVHPGMSRNAELVFLVRLGEDEVALPVIEQAFELLCQLHDQVQG